MSKASNAIEKSNIRCTLTNIGKGLVVIGCTAIIVVGLVTLARMEEE
jgi:hypothetical protein